MILRKVMVSAVALLSVSLVATGAHAQNQPPAGGGGGGRGQGRGGQGRGGMQMGPMMAIPGAFKAVNPTPEQQQKFQDLQIKMQQDMQAMFQGGGGGGDRQAMMAKMQEMSTKFQTDVEAILTPEQKTKFQAEVKMRSTPEGRLIGALDPLNLTEDQKTKILPIAKETAAKQQALMQDQNLQGQERREKNQQITDDFKAKVRPLLTPEQQPKLDTLELRGGGGRPGGGRPGGAGGQRQP